MQQQNRRPGILSAWLIVAVLAVTLSGRSQEKVELLFTNKVVTFTNLAGGVYVDANLIRANSRDLIFKTNGDFGTVPLTNLSGSTFERIGIPRDFVQLAWASERQKAEAAARERAILLAEQERLRNPADLVRVTLEAAPDRLEYNGYYGYVFHARVRMPDGKSSNVFLAKLPGRIPEWYNKVAAIEKSIAELGARMQAGSAQIAYREQGLKERQSQIDRADAVTPRVMVVEPYYGYYLDPYVSQRTAINVAQVEQKEAVSNLDESKFVLGSMQDELTNLQAQLAAMKQAESSATSVMVLFSRFLHNRSRMAVCAPEELQVGNR